MPIANLPLVYPVSRDREDRLRRVMFGDGYEQISPDGINNTDLICQVKTKPLSDCEAIELDNFLGKLQGQPFLTKLPWDCLARYYKLYPNKWSVTTEFDHNIFSFALKLDFSAMPSTFH